MKKYSGLVLIAVGVVLLVLAIMFGFKKEESSSNPTPTPAPTSAPTSTPVSAEITLGNYV